MGSENSKDCRIFCNDYFLIGNNKNSKLDYDDNSLERNLSKYQIPTNEKKQKSKKLNRALEHKEISLMNKENQSNDIKIDESTLPNLENTKDFRNVTLSEKNLTFDKNACKNKFSSSNKLEKDNQNNDNTQSNIIITIKNDAFSTENLNFSTNEKKESEENYVNENNSSEKLKNEKFNDQNSLKNNNNISYCKNLKEKLFLDFNKINKKNFPNGNYIESDRSNKSNYLMISIGEYRDGLENIANIRVGKSFSNLIKEFNLIFKFFFSNFKPNKKFQIDLITEEKDTLSIQSNKISDYNSYYSSKFSNDVLSNMTSFNKSNQDISNNIGKNFKLARDKLCVSNFSSSDNDKRKINKKLFSYFKNLIYIPIISISGEIKNYFTYKSTINLQDKLEMSEFSIKMPYFDNLYTFFINYLENCKYEEKNEDKINENKTINVDHHRKNIDEIHNENPEKFLNNSTYFDKRKKNDDNNLDFIKSILSGIQLKEKKQQEIVELYKRTDKLENFFRMIKQFSLLEIKISINPKKNSFYLTLLNIIRITDIFALIQKLDFPNQEKFFNVIKQYNLYIDEIKLNLKKDHVKIILSQFQKGINLKNFNGKIFNLFQIISQLTHSLINKQIHMNRAKKLFYENEKKILFLNDSQNLQIFIKFNIENNLITQIGILKEKAMSSLDFSHLIDEINKNSDNYKIQNKENSFKNIKLKKEFFILKIAKTENELLEEIDFSGLDFINEENHINRNLDYLKSEFTELLIPKKNVKISREFEIN